MVYENEWGWGAKTGLFYAGTNLACFIWCWFRLPETKDRAFGEIDLLFENRIPARKFRTARVNQFAHQSDVTGKAGNEHVENVA
ncbi:general substrate transporter [Penicillium verrucosum]|uniref:general substrate transporter n=1 Tax=Penicillium verrucosum TaxID=60171 RepID=UPI002544EC27|nr:general substrate transporter [Penicillium verrucosum]KAJ5920634.1 general substrate transporter [Penicillium verrucosum]